MIGLCDHARAIDQGPLWPGVRSGAAARSAPAQQVALGERFLKVPGERIVDERLCASGAIDAIAGDPAAPRP
jgi:hypothetical protein